MGYGLWQNRDFLKFWSGETISLFGSQITALALPLVAALAFEATAFQMGLLNASHSVPYLLVTLFAGVWIDRNRRRPILIGANLGRALLLGVIPVCYGLGVLRLEYLYIIIFLFGLLTVAFELAYTAYVPSLVDREGLVEANSKLQGSASVAEVSGPGLAGVLVSLLTAPVAIAFDAVSFLLSALLLSRIQKAEPAPLHRGGQGSLFREMGEGLRRVYANPYLRAIAGEAATFNLFSNMTWSIMLLYLTRELQLGPVVLGVVLGSASLGSLTGSLSAQWLGRRFGTGPAIVGSMIMACAAPLLVPLANGPHQIVLPIIAGSLFVGGMGVTISVVHVVSLRQAITPAHLMGRIAASYRFLSLGIAPIGAFLGGLLGSQMGLRPTLLMAALGTLTALGWVLFSPVPALRQLPTERSDSSEPLPEPVSAGLAP